MKISEILKKKINFFFSSVVYTNAI